MARKRNHRQQDERVLGSTKAERRRRWQELEDTLEWILSNYMESTESSLTTVTSARIDKEKMVVVVTTSHKDAQFADQLAAESYGRVEVSRDPNIIDAVVRNTLPNHMDR